MMEMNERISQLATLGGNLETMDSWVSLYQDLVSDIGREIYFSGDTDRVADSRATLTLLQALLVRQIAFMKREAGRDGEANEDILPRGGMPV